MSVWVVIASDIFNSFWVFCMLCLKDHISFQNINSLSNDLFIYLCIANERRNFFADWKITSLLFFSDSQRSHDRTMSESDSRVLSKSRQNDEFCRPRPASVGEDAQKSDAQRGW